MFATGEITGASKVHRTTTLLAAALTAAVTASACSSGTRPTAAPATSTAADSVDLAALDTGPYATTPSHPIGTAGEDRHAQRVLESQRLAAVTVGPWKIDPKLTLWGDVLNVGVTGRMPDVQTLRDNNVLPEGLPEIAERNGFIAGFSTVRLAPADTGGPTPKLWSLQNVVLRFPDEASAAAAAAQMDAADPIPAGATGPRQPVNLSRSPQSLAASFEVGNGMTAARAFTAHKSFLLCQFVKTVDKFLGVSVGSLIFSAIADQQTLLKDFVPTPVDKLPELPLDPSGRLFARTLDNPGGSTPAMIGVWDPTAWVTFEDNPPEAAAMFAEAGVDWVAQRLATVYQTRNTEAAEAMLTKVVNVLRRTYPAKPAAEVPGLPRARCFQRENAATLKDTAQSWQRVAWHFKCAAAVDRWVFTVYAGDGKAAQQRISAQYRILAGR